MKVKLDLSSYAAKYFSKEATGVDTSNVPSNSDLVCLNAEVDKIDTDKTKTFPTDLSKLSNVLDNDVGKTTVYNKLVTQVNTLDTSRFALKNQYNNEKSCLQKIIPDTDKIVKKQDCNAMVNEVEGKMPSITVLAATGILNAVENKTPNISNLTKKQIMTQNIRHWS